MSNLVSQVRQNFHHDTEAGINKQINLELHASYVYEQLAWWFNRDDVALDNFHTFFKARADEERDHSRKFMEFQNKRGGRIVLQDIAKPAKQEWSSTVEALEASIQLEKTVNQSLLDLQAIACGHRSRRAWYFNRDDIALEGFHGFFKSRADEERSHARKFMDYQNKRGGRIVLQDIARPVKQDGWTPQSAIEASLDLEKTVNQSLLDLQAIGARTNDAEFTDFIESEFLHEQVDDIKKLGDHLTNLKRVGTGLGEYLFDKQTLG
ncbi:soma ferritin-like [Oppia nitens]|uniref:soma ferritin-like n=1 Tax=Oppia nitens TaxID=1686743 RepID=UPI0023DBEAEA|nr:soma ferritin-like [Oppia nitens]